VRIVYVTHADASDPFWSVYKNGVDQAAKDLGVRVEYRAPNNSSDIVRMTELIEGAIASRPDGLAVTIPDPTALEEPIKEAVDAGIPVVAANAGADVWEEWGLLGFVGTTQLVELGAEAGRELRNEGNNNALCVVQGLANVEQNDICTGLEQGLEGEIETIGVDLNNPTDAQSKVATALQQRPDVDSILGVGSTASEVSLDAVEQAGKRDQVTVGATGASEKLLSAVRDGDALFLVQTQQYLEGYYPVQMLAQYIETTNAPVEPIVTGPKVINEEDIDQAMDAVDRGVR